jgi:Spy/CpxP family protein refolding chaperone
MELRTVRPIGLFALTLALGMSLASPALAADDTAKDGQPPVREPRGGGKDGAREGGKPGERARGEGRPAGRGNARGEAQAWILAVKGLTGLTAEQSTKIDEIVKAHETKVAEWQKTNGEEMKKLEEAGKKARESGERLNEADREKLRTLTESRPKPTDVQAKISEILTDAQKTELKTKIEKVKSENREKRREENRKGREGGAGGGGRGGEGAPPTGRGEGRGQNREGGTGR